MRVLFTIPHYFRQERESKFGSERSTRSTRVNYLHTVVDSLDLHFGRKHAFVPTMGTSCNNEFSFESKVVICTTGSDHAIGDLERCSFEHIKTNAIPTLLGYECHEILRQSIDHYDMFCFLEDDILISDSLFFWKLSWFAEKQNGQCVLLPNRYETLARGPVRKLYIDGKLANDHRNRSFSSEIQASAIQESVIKEILFSRQIEFVRPGNPHAGCFFLTREQMIEWSSRPYFLDRSQYFVGPLESAATLGIYRTFRVYKPASANAAFLEVCHLDNRYLGRGVKYGDDFVLKSPV